MYFQGYVSCQALYSYPSKTMAGICQTFSYKCISAVCQLSGFTMHNCKFAVINLKFKQRGFSIVKFIRNSADRMANTADSDQTTPLEAV